MLLPGALPEAKLPLVLPQQLDLLNPPLEFRHLHLLNPELLKQAGVEVEQLAVPFCIHRVSKEGVFRLLQVLCCERHGVRLSLPRATTKYGMHWVAVMSGIAWVPTVTKVRSRDWHVRGQPPALLHVRLVNRELAVLRHGELCHLVHLSSGRKRRAVVLGLWGVQGIHVRIHVALFGLLGRVSPYCCVACALLRLATGLRARVIAA